MPLASNTRSRYQEGTLERAARAKGPDVWVYRWRELAPDGKRVARKKVVGTVDQLKTLSEAKRASDNLRLAANAPNESTVKKVTVGEAWGHFQLHELSDPDVGRSATTIDSYREYFKAQILPQWRDVPLEDVKAVAVEKWLRSLSHLAPATRAKMRNHMSAVFSHAIRHELFFPREGINPMSRVRQGAVRLREPDVLTLLEIRAILDRIEPQAIKMMVVVAAASGLRRSEIRGLKLKWMDCDLTGRWFHLRRGVVKTHETKLKTEASRRGIPILPDLAQALLEWRHLTPFNREEDWVFASPFTNGKRPYWAESALKAHIRPAAESARIDKIIGWHTFRHSLASLLGNMKEDTETVQELMRHASSKITMDVYTHGDEEAKRSALTHTSAIFALTATAGKS